VLLPGGYKFTTQLTPFLTSAYATSSGSPDDHFNRVAGYVRLDARLTLETPDSHWAFDLIGKNLTDHVIVSGFGGLYFASKERPRNVAAQFRFRW
jgi:hypothetical protein